MIAVDHGIAPPSYTISICEGSEDTSVRETEANRLIKLPSQSGRGNQGPAALRLLDVGRHVDPEERFYDVSSGNILHAKMREVLGPVRQRPGGGRGQAGWLEQAGSLGAEGEVGGDTDSDDNGSEDDGMSDADSSKGQLEGQRASRGGWEGEARSRLDELAQLEGKLALPSQWRGAEIEEEGRGGSGRSSSHQKPSVRADAMSAPAGSVGVGAVPILTPSGASVGLGVGAGAGTQPERGGALSRETLWREGVGKRRDRSGGSARRGLRGETGGRWAPVGASDALMSSMLGYSGELKAAQRLSEKEQELAFRRQCGIHQPGNTLVGAGELPRS